MRVTEKLQTHVVGITFKNASFCLSFLISKYNESDFISMFIKAFVKSNSHK